MGTNLISDVQTPIPGAAATTPNCELWSRGTVAHNFDERNDPFEFQARWKGPRPRHAPGSGAEWTSFSHV